MLFSYGAAYMETANVRNLLKQGKALSSYYRATQMSEPYAVETKRAFFVDCTSLIGRQPVMQTRTGKRAYHERPDGTGRTTRTMADLRKLHPWWQGIQYASESEEERFASANSGKCPENACYSKEPMTVGTHVHESMGHYFGGRCFSSLYPKEAMQAREWEVVIPGRMIHQGLPWLGVRPDALVVDSEMNFLETYERMWMYNDRKKLTGEACQRGQPLVTCEFKTIVGKLDGQKRPGAILPDDVQLLKEAYASAGKGDVLREETTRIIKDKLLQNKWMTNCDGRANAPLPKFVGVKSQKHPFLLKMTKMMQRHHFDALKGHRCSSRLFSNLGYVPGGRAQDEEAVDVTEVVNPGRAFADVYEVGPGAANEKLFTVEWEEAPFVLNLRCDHFNQVMVQHCTARQMNDDVKCSFAVVIMANTAPVFKKVPVQIGIVYGYDVGVTAYGAQQFSKTLYNELGTALDKMEGDGDGSGLLLPPLDTDEDMTYMLRKGLLYSKPAQVTEDGSMEVELNDSKDDDDDNSLFI